jgi:hypothetical protein
LGIRFAKFATIIAYGNWREYAEKRPGFQPSFPGPNFIPIEDEIKQLVRKSERPEGIFDYPDLF